MSTATISKLSGIDEIATLMNSRRRAILVNTFEEERFQDDMKPLVEEKALEAYTWTITAGLIDLITGKQVEKIHDPVKLMDFIEKKEKSAIFIIKDFHDIWTNFQAKRRVRDILETPDKIYKPLILVSPQVNIPMELEKLITMVSYELPTREQVEEQLAGMEAFLRTKDLNVPEGRDRVGIINALVGMTKSEIVNVLKKSVAKNKRIALEEIVAEKEQVIKKTGLLEYVTKLGDMSNVGGLDVLKDWFDDAYYAFDHEARQYNIDPVRGVVVAGFPGTGKSLVSKSVAHYWNLPLLKMNMSDIMDSKVGQSEKNIDRALKLAEAVSPCVLWVDEFEKALSGMGSSDKSDGGTTSRVIQSLLTWLSDKGAPVFVIATANDITKLPAELTRAGRFDDIFFVSLPSQEEREDILKIHLTKRGYAVTNGQIDLLAKKGGEFLESDIKTIASKMEDFTGAEIEQVVSESGRRAYAAWRKKEREDHHILVSDIEEQAGIIVPLSKRNPELLTDLRSWAKQSAKCASSAEHNLIHQISESKATLHEVHVEFPDLDMN